MAKLISVRHKTAGRKRMSSKTTIVQTADRRFGLSARKRAALKANAGKGFVNPYRPSSTYGAIVAAFMRLGVNRPHEFRSIQRAVRAVMGATAWTLYANKPKRNKATGLDASARLEQSVNVLRRVRDYGKPLLQLGARIEVVRRGDTKQYALMTR